MIELRVAESSAPSVESAARDRLREAAHEFEGVLIAQLFREMRATVPASEESGQEQEIFTAMLDDAMAGQLAGRTTRGLGDALYRQLVARMDEAAGPEGAAPRAE